MPMNYPPWDTNIEPNEGNIRTWMDNFYGKYEGLEQARWNESNIDTLFYAGEQRAINSYFNFNPQYNAQQFHFNLIQQPVNMVTGYQRQHRKSIDYLPLEGSKQAYSDDLTTVVKYANNYRGILEKVSTAYEQSAISGMVLMQPYLDFTDDPVNGTLDLKVWSYNSFMTDVYWRESDMSDANVIWCQQYISKTEAIQRFPDKQAQIQIMAGYGNRNGKFYFLPENYNLARNDLLVMSYIWFRSKRKKKMLYNRNDGVTYEYGDNDDYLDDLVKSTEIFEIIEIDVPTWKLAVVINDTMMYLNYNPLKFDECPLIPVYWNYDPHIAQYNLRVRSLVRSMRDSQFLLNRRIILNHDISESSINSGWMRQENSIVNEDDLRYAGQGKDIIVKEGFEIQQAIQKIIPNAVPPSDMQLADQLADFIFRTSGVNQELLGMADDAKSGIEVMLRQGAGLVTLQKYFDQWDTALKLLGRLEQKIIQNMWSPAKIARILGKEPNPEFLSKTFSRYDVVVAEGLDTAIQQQSQFRQMLEINQMLGGIIPAKFILKNATIHGKNEIIEAVDKAEQMAAEVQQQQSMLQHAMLDAQIQNLQAKSASEVATAKERYGRFESNIGLLEERISQISKNRSLSAKAKAEALQILLETVATFGQAATDKEARELEAFDYHQKNIEDQERNQAHKESQATETISKLLGQNPIANQA